MIKRKTTLLQSKLSYIQPNGSEERMNDNREEEIVNEVRNGHNFYQELLF
jgi:hypothetical protein